MTSWDLGYLLWMCLEDLIRCVSWIRRLFGWRAPGSGCGMSSVPSSVARQGFGSDCVMFGLMVHDWFTCSCQFLDDV